jgi:hypothetical protein
MACWRYDAATRTFYEIKPTQLTKPDRGENLSFKEQVMRGYKRQEAKGALINGKAKGIKRIWNSN